jgi:hypothetical protein
MLRSKRITTSATTSAKSRRGKECIALARLEALGTFCASAAQIAVGSAFAYGPVVSRSAGLCVSPVCSTKLMSVRPYDVPRRAREMTH